MGVEPTYQPWEGRILPINYIRIYIIYYTPIGQEKSRFLQKFHLPAAAFIFLKNAAAPGILQIYNTMLIYFLNNAIFSLYHRVFLHNAHLDY